MKGSVTGHMVAVIPMDVEKVSKGGIVLAEDYDSNQKSRAEAGSTRGIVIGVGEMAWKAYDGNDPDWKPWAAVNDIVWFQRHVSKIIEDKDNLDIDGNPTKIFVMADENVIWNEGKQEVNKDE